MDARTHRPITCALAAGLALLAGCGESQRGEAPGAPAPAAGAAPSAQVGAAGAAAAASALPAATAAPAPSAGVVPVPADAAAAAAARSAVALPHLAVGAKVVASSTHLAAPGEGPVSALVDGDPTTRWSSDYADNQELILDLGAAKPVGTIRMMWEKAAAKSYTVQISLDGTSWSAPIDNAGGGEGPRSDDLAINAPLRFVRVTLKERATEWGFSLYELVVNAPK